MVGATQFFEGKNEGITMSDIYDQEDWEDYVSNIMGKKTRQYLTCSECGNYIDHSVYWEINGEVLCDDCAKSIYQRGVSFYD